MPDKSSPAVLHEPPPRFRILSLLWITTLVAATAAILGPLLRRFSDGDQTRVVAMWIATIPFAVAWAAIFRWDRRRIPRKAGAVRFNLPLVGRFASETQSRQIGRAIFNATVIGGTLAFYSSTFLGHGRQSFWERVLTCALLGLIVGQFALSYFPRKLALCENGYVMLGRFKSWAEVRNAQWAPNRPGVCRLRTLAYFQRLGEMHVNVALQDADSLEEFLRQKTTFVGGRDDAQAKSPRSVTGG